LKRWQTTDLVHPDDLPQASVEHPVRGADGKYRWFVVRRLPQRDLQGRVIRWYLLLSDIDDRKRAEEALRESEETFRQMVLPAS
jgi:PAS domain S-box-containing protein